MYWRRPLIDVTSQLKGLWNSSLQPATIFLPDGQLSERTGHGPGFDPGHGYPFTGTGFTASNLHTVPEYFLPGGTRMMPGAQMYSIGTDCTEKLLAVLDSDGNWIRVGAHG